jgi:peptidoglycan hydrolase CwlO-like protein
LVSLLDVLLLLVGDCFLGNHHRDPAIFSDSSPERVVSNKERTRHDNEVISMRTCEEHRNTVVVYTTTYCPLCEAETERDDANNKLNDAESEIGDLKGKVDSLKDELQDAEIRLASGAYCDRRD